MLKYYIAESEETASSITFHATLPNHHGTHQKNIHSMLFLHQYRKFFYHFYMKNLRIIQRSPSTDFLPSAIQILPQKETLFHIEDSARHRTIENKPDHFKLHQFK